jgi:hypothetical protein
MISVDHNSWKRNLTHEVKKIFKPNIVIATLVEGQAPKLIDFMETTTVLESHEFVFFQIIY